MKYYIHLPFKIALSTISIGVITSMDISFRILSFDFKRPFLVTKEDLIEIKNWTLKKTKTNMEQKFKGDLVDYVPRAGHCDLGDFLCKCKSRSCKLFIEEGCDHWHWGGDKQNIIKKIHELRKKYEFRHMFSGSFGFVRLCDCCGKPTTSIENLYHKTEQGKGISICPDCSNLWRITPLNTEK